MEQTAVEKKFGKYVMASMITMFLQSAYSMIDGLFVSNLIGDTALSAVNVACLLYTSDAADEEASGDLGGRRLIKKKKKPRPECDH